MFGEYKLSAWCGGESCLRVAVVVAGVVWLLRVVCAAVGGGEPSGAAARSGGIKRRG